MPYTTSQTSFTRSRTTGTRMPMIASAASGMRGTSAGTGTGTLPTPAATSGSSRSSSNGIAFGATGTWTMTTTFDPEAWIVNRIYNRIKVENKNAIVGFFGLPRKGKTYSALSLAEQVGERLRVPLSLDNVTFSVAGKIGADGLMARVHERPPRRARIGPGGAGPPA